MGKVRQVQLAILQIDSNLPVELSSFTAKVLRSGGVKLDWRTETEVNNYGFEIERLQDYNIENYKIGLTLDLLKEMATATHQKIILSLTTVQVTANIHIA